MQTAEHEASISLHDFNRFTEPTKQFADNPKYTDFRAAITRSFLSFKELTDKEKLTLSTDALHADGYKSLCFNYNTGLEQYAIYERRQKYQNMMKTAPGIQEVSGRELNGDFNAKTAGKYKDNKFVFLAIKMREFPITAKEQANAKYLRLVDVLDHAGTIALRYARKETDNVGSRYYTMFGHIVASLVFSGCELEKILDEEDRGLIVVLARKGSVQYRVTFHIRRVNRAAFKYREDYTLRANDEDYNAPTPPNLDFIESSVSQ